MIAVNTSASSGETSRSPLRNLDVRCYVVKEVGCASVVVGRQVVSLSARVVGRDAMTSNNTPPGAAGLGIWGNLGIWVAFGSAFGLLVGGFFDNAGLGIALGPALAVAAWAVFMAGRNDAGGS
jgi:hypothetical protein